MYPITINGRTVTLREFRTDDAASSLSILGDDEVTRWLSFDSRSLAEAQTLIEGAIHRARLNPRTEYYMAVTLPGDRLIGFVRLGLDGVQAAKLGYAIRADEWGHGYATDAARTMTEFGFRKLGLHRISAAIGPENEASIAVVRHLGMQYEGRIRHHVFTNGSWRDSLLYSVLTGEWDSPNAKESAHPR